MKNIGICSGLTFLLLVVCLVVGMGCKKTTPAPASPPAPSGPGANEVWMQNTAFNPTSITVSVNSTVKWTNKDGMTHNVTSSTGAFSSGSIPAGGTYSHQFTTTGSFPYSCTIHAGMNGTVIVQ
jgi:plastocyanin